MATPHAPRVATTVLTAALLSWVVPGGGGAQDAPHGLKENLDLPYEADGEVEVDEDAPEIHIFYGQQLEGDGIFYVIDRSSTMQDAGELAVAKREVIRNIREFSEGVQFGIVFFESGVIQFPPSGQPAEANAAMKAAATSYVQSAAGGFGTCCLEGLATGLRMASRATSRRKVLVYVGDGGGTCQGADEARYLQTTLAAITARNWERVQIHTIGVLDVGRIQEDFLRRLASANGGSYRRISGGAGR